MLKEMKVYDTFLFIDFKSLHFHLSTLETEPFQKALLLKPFSRASVFISIFGRFSMDAGRKRINKYAFSYGNGLVWSERQLTRQPVMSFQQKGIDIDTNRPGAGAPNVDKSGNLKVRKGQTLTKSSNGRKYSTL